MATAIKKKPGLGVSNLGAPSRQANSRKMKATWKVPKALTKTSSASRATDLEIDWSLIIPGKDPKKVIKTGKETLTESTINLNNLTIGKKTYARDSFYPFKGKPKLSGVTVSVIPYNKKGKGKPAKATRSFEAPRTPSIADFVFNDENGHLSVDISTNEGADHKERYDTWYTMKIRDVRQSENSWYQYNTNNPDSIGVTKTSATLTYDAVDYATLDLDDEYIEVTVTATARGYAGNSTPASETYYISYPARATIGDITVSSKDSTGKVIIPVNTNNSKEHPVDQVVLEYLANVTYQTAAEIPGSETGTDSGITDDAECMALSIPVANLIPERGKYTWIRVKSWHASQTRLVRYSDWVRVKDLETPAASAADDDIAILSATPGADGRSAIVLLGWNADGEDDSTGTELTWSEAADAWKSTDDPDSYEFTWSDADTEGPITADGVTYQDHATITIKGLDEGTVYYIRARRYLEGETTTYSKYSNQATVLTSEKPEMVIASCDRYVPAGQSLPVYWTFSGNGLQTEWHIMDTNGTLLAEGQGSIGATQIEADKLSRFAENNSITFQVYVSTGSGFVASENHTVTIINAPVLNIDASTPLEAQAFEFSAAVSALSDLIVIVSSQGAAGQFPTGILRQTAGDTLFSDVIAPEWTEENNSFKANISLPDSLDFWDLGEYILTVTAIDRTTGLRSEPAEISFAVDWENKAVDPFEAVTLTPIDEYDEEGFHRMAVQIDLTPPAGSGESDVYDIYRLTGDGAVLIGESFPLTHTTVDEYAPYGADGTLAYRIAIRTVDGDVEFADVEYELPGQALRLDWESGFLELPYNLSIGDTYKKDVDIRLHMDGSIDGYWNQNITRSGSLSTDVVKLEQQNEIDQARQLARYAGAVFVRTPEGSAYEADVQVTDLSASNDKIMAIALDATEVGLTQEFILPNPFVLEDEEE